MAKPRFTPERMRAASKAIQLHTEAIRQVTEAALRARAQIGSFRNDWLNAIRDGR